MNNRLRPCSINCSDNAHNAWLLPEPGLPNSKYVLATVQERAVPQSLQLPSHVQQQPFELEGGADRSGCELPLGCEKSGGLQKDHASVEKSHVLPG